MTKQRAIILEKLKKVTTHPTADEIYLMVKKRIPNISLGTVYRSLNVLKESGEISELNCDNFNRFDGTTAPHSHFTCNKCKKMFDIRYELDFNLDKKISKKTGFKTLGHRIEFFGICNNCKR